IEHDGLAIEPLEIDTHTTQFDLSVGLTRIADGLQGVITYSTDLFDEQTVRGLLTEFECMLREIVTCPGTRLSELLLSEARQLKALAAQPEADDPHDAISRLDQLSAEEID